MKNQILLLDCTLRDGGYVNNFNFGEPVIKDIVSKLGESSIDIIECGFLKSDIHDPDISLYGNIEQIIPYISEKRKNSIYVAMVAYGDISIDEISPVNHKSIDGIRITFHQEEISEAFDFAVKLKEKGYKVFMQPVGSTFYSDRELLDLIDQVNLLEPFAFYIVDTLGLLYKNELLRLFYIIDNNLNKDIRIGFHSHNNLQLSFSNAQELLILNVKRDLIIDVSIYGMGRGAGNLSTELMVKYINDNIHNKYDLLPILEIFDCYIENIFKDYGWGYSIPYFLSASVQCHPNYVTHLLDKDSISLKEISTILNQIAPEKSILYDRNYIETLYQDHLKNSVDDIHTVEMLSQRLKGKKVLILGGGDTVISEKSKIQNYISEQNPIIISINRIPEGLPYHYVFISNIKKYSQLKPKLISEKISDKCVITSNIKDETGVKYIVNYASYLNASNAVSDNAGLMLISLLKKIGVTQIAMAGFDGFVPAEIWENKKSQENFATKYYLEILKTKEIQDQLNKFDSTLLIEHITTSEYYSITHKPIFS